MQIREEKRNELSRGEEYVVACQWMVKSRNVAYTSGMRVYICYGEIERSHLVIAVFYN